MAMPNKNLRTKVSSRVMGSFQTGMKQSSTSSSGVCAPYLGSRTLRDAQLSRKLKYNAIRGGKKKKKKKEGLGTRRSPEATAKAFTCHKLNPVGSCFGVRIGRRYNSETSSTDLAMFWPLRVIAQDFLSQHI